MLIQGNFPKNSRFELKNVLNNKNQSRTLKYLIVSGFGQLMGKDRKKWSFRQEKVAYNSVFWAKSEAKWRPNRDHR